MFFRMKALIFPSWKKETLIYISLYMYISWTQTINSFTMISDEGCDQLCERRALTEGHGKMQRGWW